MTTSTTARVCGEPVADLVTALRGLRFSPDQDGMMRCSGPIGAAALRALMRVEAELAAADADSPDADSPPGRTRDQRRADALVLLVQRLVASTATTVAGARCPASPEIG